MAFNFGGRLYDGMCLGSIKHFNYAHMATNLVQDNRLATRLVLGIGCATRKDLNFAIEARML